MPSIHHQHRSVTGGTARAAVFGISDGLVSNVSLILGFAGSGADAAIVRLAGLAGAIAGGISMAAGEWISVSAQNELIERELAIERRELLHNPPPRPPSWPRCTWPTAWTPDACRAGRRRRDAATRRGARRPRPRRARRRPRASSPRRCRRRVSSIVCFLFGALLPVIPWLLGATGTAPTIALGRHRRRRRRGRRGAHRPPRRPPDRRARSLRQVLIVLVACGVTYGIGQLVGVSV